MLLLLVHLGEVSLLHIVAELVQVLGVVADVLLSLHLVWFRCVLVLQNVLME